MGDVISWSKLNKIKKSLGVVKDDVSNVKNTFLNWSKDWTTARAEKIDTVTANSETIKSTMAKESTLTVVNNSVDSLKSKNGLDEIRSDLLEKPIGGNFTVNGKGALYYVFTNTAMSGVFEIKVDGVSIVRQQYSQTGTVELGYFAEDIVVPYSDGGYYVPIKPSNAGKYIKYNIPTGSYQAVQKINMNFNGTTPNLVSTEHPIRFQKSLQILMNKPQNSAYIGYTLE